MSKKKNGKHVAIDELPFGLASLGATDLGQSEKVLRLTCPGCPQPDGTIRDCLRLSCGACAGSGFVTPGRAKELGDQWREIRAKLGIGSPAP